jgi:hypothetical protein
MPRPARLDLRTSRPALRPVPMPGANLPIELVPLRSAGEAFTMLGRFPAGFERPGPGGYLAAEEFLVLDGDLELEDVVVGRGDLCAVPARWERTVMRSPGGCTVLAWFSGPADYRPAAELDGRAGEGMRRVRLLGSTDDGCVLRTAEARWLVTGPAGPPTARPADVVDADLATWAHLDVGDNTLPPGRLLVRVPEPADPGR